MSLIISNRATEKQLAALVKAGYTGDTTISVTEAAEILDALYEQARHEELAARQYIEFEGMLIEIF